ncbi:MAG TPA: hypothetical protein VI386_02700 [Candidatus Sulfotelmatobacter sp.]
MFSRRAILLFASICLAGLLAGCGSSSNKATPPPSGGFSASNLSGTYVFSSTGLDVNGAPTSVAGSFSANGSGTITGGTIDINDVAFTSPVVGQGISGGTYTVTADGRGQAKLTVLTPFGRSLVLDFVLTSNSHGLIAQFDGNATGSGSLDLQSTVTQAQLAGSYAFSFSGVDASGNLPFGTVGSFTLDSSGTITAGVQDFNDTGFAYPQLTLSGQLVAQATGAPFTATLTAVDSSSASPFGTLTFDVYAVDATHLKFVETDNFQNTMPVMSGDAFTQQGASVTATATTYVFAMGGGVNAPLALGGVMPIDGAGTITGGSVDINNNFTVTSAPLSFSGSYAAGGTIGGRTLFNLSGFSVAAQLVGYPTASAGLQLLETDGAGFISGSALPQTNTTLASGQGFAMNVSAFNGGEEDDIAEFTTNSTGFNGLVDFNDQGSTSFDQTLSGSYAVASPPPGRYSFTSNAFDGAVYVADNSTALFVELDNNQLGVGTLQLQNGSQVTGASRLGGTPLTVSARTGIRSAAKWRQAK